MADVEIITPPEEEGLRRITLIDYGLHIASPIVSMMLLSVIALIINYVKRDDARGTIWHSHMNWMIRSCWWTLFWLAVTGVIALVSFGLLSFALVIPVLWYLYRMIRGLLAALDGRPMPMPQ
ncbi:MAG: hypothetical protein M9951_15355 [Burkholderiaceae bacterium]|jgi:uncharacterized membrane protein|nr:hypothetical protein [Burkholderiaceae bacterium]MEB2319656.1 hypothetical protein [Pseudomonadota bacterium]